MSGFSMFDCNCLQSISTRIISRQLAYKRSRFGHTVFLLLTMLGMHRPLAVHSATRQPEVRLRRVTLYGLLLFEVLVRLEWETGVLETTFSVLPLMFTVRCPTPSSTWFCISSLNGLVKSVRRGKNLLRYCGSLNRLYLFSPIAINLFSVDTWPRGLSRLQVCLPLRSPLVFRGRLVHKERL